MCCPSQHFEISSLTSVSSASKGWTSNRERKTSLYTWLCYSTGICSSKVNGWEWKDGLLTGRHLKTGNMHSNVAVCMALLIWIQPWYTLYVSKELLKLLTFVSLWAWFFFNFTHCHLLYIETVLILITHVEDVILHRSGRLRQFLSLTTLSQIEKTILSFFPSKFY